MLFLRRRRLAALSVASLLALLGIPAAAWLLPPPWAIVPHVVAAIAICAMIWAGWRNLIASQERQRVILEISHEMARKVEVGDLLDYVVQAILGLVPLADKCVIHLLDEQGQRLYPRYSSQPDWHQQLGLPAGEGIAGQALRERATIVIDDVRDNADFLPLASKSDLRALLVAPLGVHETVLGTLSLNSRTPGAFSEHDKSLMTIVAAQLSSALHQSLLHEQTQLQERYVESLLLHLPCGVALLDDRMRLVHYNAALAHLLGPDPSRIVGRAVSPDAAEASLRLLATLVGPESASRDNGQGRLVSVGAPIASSLRVYVADVTTISGRKQTLIMILDETEQQSKVNVLQGILSVASREILPGLDAIRGYSALLGGALTNHPGPRAWASEVQAKSGDLTDRARDLEFLRADCAGEVIAQRKPIELDELVAEWRALTEPQTEAKGLGLSVSLNVEDSGFVTLDVDKLDHAVRNLLSNAVHRSYRGGDISLTATLTAVDLAITVHDTGRTLTAEDHACILQGEACGGDNGRTSTGNALALLASRRLIESMGGHLWIEQDANLGVKTQILVPL